MIKLSQMIVCLFSLIFLANAHALTVRLQGEQAKTIYNGLTAIPEDGSAGHMTRQGKNILCRYTSADVDDSKGKLLSSKSPARYICVMQIDENGLASPGQI
jgi:hypothetical protein